MRISKALEVFALACFAAYFVDRPSFFDLPGQPGDYTVVGLVAMVLAYWIRARQAKDV